MTFDVVIVGGGPTGISCAIESKKAGLSYVIIEKGSLVNSIYNFPTNMTFFSTAPKIEIGNIPFIAHQDKPTRAEALEYYRRLVFHYQLNIHLGERVLDIVHTPEFTIKTNKAVYKAANVILATGYYDNAMMMNVPGENLSKVKHYYDDAHPYIQKNVIVVGAANSACDVALELWTKGANVTMVVRGADLYQGVKYWILPNITNRIKEGSIKAYFEATIDNITEYEVAIRTSSGVVTVPNDYLLAMTGYQIDYSFLAQCGIVFTEDEQQKPICNEDTFESNVASMYVAGVIVSGRATSKLFIENTRHHGEVIINDILRKKATAQKG